MLVKLFDKGDGQGADWRLLLESLYRAGFQITDERPDDDARRALMRRVHEGSYRRLTGETGAGETEAGSMAARTAPAAGLKARGPRPPR